MKILVYASSITHLFKEKVEAFDDAGTNKPEVKSALSDLKSFLFDNVDKYESSAYMSDMDRPYLFNVTDNRVWYLNKSGTLFVLAPNGEWLKFNQSGGIYNDGRVSKQDVARIKALMKS